MSKRIFQYDKSGAIQSSGYWEFHLEDSKIICSKQQYAILRLPYEVYSPYTKEFFSSFLADDAETTKLENTIQTVVNEKIMLSEEFKIRNRNNELRYFLSSFQGIPNEDGKISKVIGFTQDVTATKEILDELEHLQEKVEVFLSAEAQTFRKAVQIFNWKQDLLAKDSSMNWRHGALSLINTSLMQGNGIGSLITSLGTLFRKAKEVENNYEIPKNILEFIKENYTSSRKLASSLSMAQEIFEDSFELKDSILISDLKDRLHDLSKELNPMKSIKMQTIVFSENSGLAQHKITCNQEKLLVAFKEIFINAMKYSPNGSKILVLFIIQDHGLILKVINPLIENTQIDHADEILVFEPFYRMDKSVDERYYMEEFGVGLGLSVVKRLIEKQKGKVYFNIVKVNTFNLNQAKNEACITILIPLAYC